MNVRWMQRLLTMSLIAVGAASSGCCAATPPAGWQTYRSPGYGFTINYPGDGSFTSGYQLDPLGSTISACNAASAACFQYKGHAFDGTIIESLKVSVNILGDRGTEAECSDISEQPVKTILIHGARFHFAETRGGGGDESEIINVYRAFHQHICFEVTLATVRFDYSPEEYEEYGLHPFDPCALRSAQDEMSRMLQSFTFTRRARNDRVFKHRVQ